MSRFDVNFQIVENEYLLTCLKSTMFAFWSLTNHKRMNLKDVNIYCRLHKNDSLKTRVVKVGFGAL